MTQAMSTEAVNETWFRAWYDTNEEADAMQSRHQSRQKSAQASFEDQFPTPEQARSSGETDINFG